MNIFFWVCFGVGAGYTVIAFLLGEVLNLADFDTDMDLSGGVSPLKPSVIAAFVTVFGGAGLLLQRVMALILVLPLAALLGLTVAFLMYRFIIVPLARAQNTSAVEIQSLIGQSAKVTEKIFQGGYGQITYHVNGNTYTSPAKAENGGEVARGMQVEIMYIQDNTYFVREK
jgi:membrane protein implicated in regulation of membrane protease activity